MDTRKEWRLSVEFEKEKVKDSYREIALCLLDAANERNDITLENGNTLARGIFTQNCEYEFIAKLIDLCAAWTSSVINVNGRRLDLSESRQIPHLLKCACHRAYCQQPVPEQRLVFFGCHLMQIGLLDYRFEYLKAGDRTWWFSYFCPDVSDEHKFVLDKEGLVNSLGITRFCPKFPGNISSIISRLPDAIHLKTQKDEWNWILPQKLMRSKCSVRFPPVIPRYPGRYQRWIIQKFKDIA